MVIIFSPMVLRDGDNLFPHPTFIATSLNKGMKSNTADPKTHLTFLSSESKSWSFSSDNYQKEPQLYPEAYFSILMPAFCSCFLPSREGGRKVCLLANLIPENKNIRVVISQLHYLVQQFSSIPGPWLEYVDAALDLGSLCRTFIWDTSTFVVI